MKNQLLCKHNILTLCVLITVLADAASGRGVINGTNQEEGSVRVEKIIRGMRSQPNSRIAPYMALIKTDKGNNIVGTCGGAIIHKEWVLTAAHCVHGIDKSKMRVFVGALQQQLGSPGQQLFSVRQVTVHSDFQARRGSYNDHDIALLRLQGQIDTSIGNVRVAARLANGVERFEWTECVIAGWGATESSKPRSSGHLMEMTIPSMISTQECAQLYAGAGTGSQGQYMQNSKSWKEHHICVFDFENPRGGACKGDSGGPLICGPPGDDVLVGISLSGPCDPDLGAKREVVPDIYTRVEPHLTWINQVQSSATP